MKGLLYKDIYIMFKMCKVIIIMNLVFILVYLFSSDNMFFVFFPCIISGMIPMTLISYDEKERWDKYAASLPYTRAQLVSSKYLIGLLGSIIVFVLVAAAYAFKMITAGNFSFLEYLAVIITVLAVSLIAPAILYPFVFRFGSEKGRIFYYIVVGISCACSTMFVINTSFVPALGDSLIIAAIFAAAVILYISSWLLSIHFYNKRDL